MITGDFNYTNSDCYIGDPVTPQRARAEVLTFFYGLHQLIKTTIQEHVLIYLLLTNLILYWELAFIALYVVHVTCQNCFCI